MYVKNSDVALRDVVTSFLPAQPSDFAMYLVVGAILVTQVLSHVGRLVAHSYLGTLATIYITLAFLYQFAWKIFLWPNVFSPLRAIPGPTGHWFYGNFREIFREQIGVNHLKWMKEYPNQPFIRYHGLFNQERLLTNTQAAHQYILTNCYEYPKPGDVGFLLKTILGAEGILFAEGETHKRQRKQMNPSFSYANLKSMMPIFWTKTEGLVDAWKQMLKSSPSSEIEVLAGLSSATLDIIGSAGFGYEFNSIASLNDPSIRNALAEAYSDMFDTTKVSRVLALATFYLPWIRHLPFKRHNELNHDIYLVKHESDRIVAEKSAKLEAGEELGNDIFALLLKDNHRKALEKDPTNPPMTLVEVGHQTMTLLAAGHETTSAGTTWALHALSIHPEIQGRLRQELLDAGIGPGETPTFEHIESLHYLNNVVKEVLRFYPPVPMTRRWANVSATIEGAYIPKGTEMFVAPICINKNPVIWGPDGEIFNPDRWDNLPKTHNNYAMETFLHGARGCIGQRFAVVEMKCLLAGLVSNLKFEPKKDHVVEPKSSITMRPKGGLPLIVTII